MNAIEIARRLAELGAGEEVCRAYTLALQEGGLAPEEEMEAALYILQSGGDYKVAYTCFRSLYDRGLFREDCLGIMTQAFYQPNVKLQKAQYERNCKALSKYPYLFRKDFLSFNALPVRFYPFDDDGCLPFHPAEERFDDYVNFSRPVVSRNFFHNLEKPILARDVYSQYELEYLNDNVRPSEWVGRENHIYLHYTDWGEFCAHLQVLNVRSLLKDKKIVFLIGDEVSQYPIDFKARFGLDYSQYPVKPIGIREVNRLIWHTQLASHNGGDFFNEIFDAHPNLISTPSLMMDSVEAALSHFQEDLGRIGDAFTAEKFWDDLEPRVIRELFSLPERTEKDFFTALFLGAKKYTAFLDPAARIAPAIFFQPHFANLVYSLEMDDRGRAVLNSPQNDSIRNSPVFRGFKYIKTFTPMRRPTTSYGGAVRFAFNGVTSENEDKRNTVIDDEIMHRLLNRSFMIDPRDYRYADSVLVRFEDGKLNPKATFTALAAFLDLPYTESMTYCSLEGGRDPESLAGNDLGFSPAAIYRTYDDYANDAERYFLEYFLRDAYEEYGYDFHYYDGATMDEERIKELIGGFTTMNYYMRESWKRNVRPGAEVHKDGQTVQGLEAEQGFDQWLDDYMTGNDERRLEVAKTLLRGLRFVNKNGQPLQMMPKLKLDPALLEQPLYH